MDLTQVRQRQARRERIEARLKRASFRLEMAHVERLWAIVSAHRDGRSVRDIATTVELSATRVHQLLADPGAAMVAHAFSALRELGWPAPEDPGDHDPGLGGRPPRRRGGTSGHLRRIVQYDDAKAGRPKPETEVRWRNRALKVLCKLGYEVSLKLKDAVPKGAASPELRPSATPA